MANHDIEMLLNAFLKDSEMSECPIHEYRFIEPAAVPFQADVRHACEKNMCGMYGKCWTCPPGVGDWEALRDKYSAYAHGLVFSTRHELEDSFDFEGMEDGAVRHRALDDALCASLRAVGADFALLGTGGCKLCAKCAYPDAPCRHPDQARPSMESTGISVVELTRLTGLHYINGVNTVTYFSILFWN